MRLQSAGALILAELNQIEELRRPQGGGLCRETPPTTEGSGVGAGHPLRRRGLAG